jgi:hypothetical protein
VCHLRSEVLEHTVDDVVLYLRILHISNINRYLYYEVLLADGVTHLLPQYEFLQLHHDFLRREPELRLQQRH